MMLWRSTWHEENKRDGTEGWNGGMEWPEEWNQNGRKGDTNRLTTNQAVAPDQQRPKQPKCLAPGHHIPMAAEPQRHPNHGFRMRKTEKWTTITATAGGRAKRMYKNQPLYHKMTNKIDVKRHGLIGGVNHTIKRDNKTTWGGWRSRSRDVGELEIGETSCALAHWCCSVDSFSCNVLFVTLCCNLT